jgi:hypothetical protein
MLCLTTNYLLLCLIVKNIVDATSGERQLEGEGQIHHYNNREILCLRLRAHSPVGPIAKREKIYLPTFREYFLA